MTVRRVAVTGLGVLSPVGNDPKTFLLISWQENQALNAWKQIL